MNEERQGNIANTMLAEVPEYLLCSAIWYADLPTQNMLPFNIEKGIVVCGCEDSSEFLMGGGQIADTGDFSDCLCPVCFSHKLEGSPIASVPEYDGIHKIKIPIDLLIQPYKKFIASQSDTIDDLYDLHAKIVECNTQPPSEEVDMIPVTFAYSIANKFYGSDFPLSRKQFDDALNDLNLL